MTIFNKFNFVGMKSLYLRETNRFLSVFIQTVLSPILTNYLFLSVFIISTNNLTMGGVDFIEFIVPGLLMMTIIQNAYANSSSSIIISKTQGNIIDMITSPLSSLEIIIAFGLSAITRSFFIFVIMFIASLIIVPFKIHSIFDLIFFFVMSSVIFSTLGLVVGIYAKTFDEMAVANNFVIVPLTFLSGTFYTSDRLPEFFQKLILFNPFYYLIDGFRYALIGHTSQPLEYSYIFLTFVLVVLVSLTYYCLESGKFFKN